MYVKAYQYKNRYFSVWFRDDGWMLAILPLSRVCGGLLKAEFPTDRTLTIIKSARKEWKEIPYEPCMIHGGATHHLSITRWLGDCEFEGILKVMREFIAEVLW